jgi:hypothetical protein
VREIDLGLDFGLSAARAALSLRWSSTLSAQILADTISFIGFDGARVRLLFSYSNLQKDIKNRLALDFQFPGQIVDSNFTHPPFALSKIPLDDHHNPHGMFIIGAGAPFVSFVRQRRSPPRRTPAPVLLKVFRLARFFRLQLFWC